MRTPDALCPVHPQFTTRRCIRCQGEAPAQRRLAEFEQITVDMEAARKRITELAEARADAAWAALAAGVKRGELARVIGVSPGIITRLLQREDVA